MNDSRYRDRQFDDPWLHVTLTTGVEKANLQDALRLAYPTDVQFAKELARRHGILGLVCLRCAERKVDHRHSNTILCEKCDRAVLRELTKRFKW